MIHEVEPHLLEVFGQETDLPLLAAGTVPFFIVQHPRVMASVVAGAIAPVIAGAATRLYALLSNACGRRLERLRCGHVSGAVNGLAALH